MLLNSAIILIAALHIWFCIIEMFLWQKPIGLKAFKLDRDFARKSAKLAANQGLYNLFLSAGLIWSVFSSNPTESFNLKIFFLGCVAIAGVYGGITVSKRIFTIQGLPAILILIYLFFN